MSSNATGWLSSDPPVVWRPQQNPLCAPVPVHRWHTAVAVPTGLPWTGMTGCVFPQAAMKTPCAEFGLVKKKSRAITSASPTKACGRCAMPAHVRPAFRESDLQQNPAVNQ